MSLISILIAIVIFGIILSIVNFYVPLDGKIKTLLNMVAAIMVIVCLLNALGFVGTPVFTHLGNWHLRQQGKSAAIGQSAENTKTIDMMSPGDSTIKNPQTGYWTCPMHPDIHQSASGNCPVCGRNLVFKKSDKYTTRMSSVDDGNMK